MTIKQHNPYYGQTTYAGVYSGNPALPLPVMNVQFRLGARLMIMGKDKDGRPESCYAIVDRITGRGTWIKVLQTSKDKLFYQKLQATDEVYIAPKWLVFPTFDENEVERMRLDQLNPERDFEFIRIDYSGVTK